MRLRLDVAYHGAGFKGWQSQACGNAVQDHLENAFAALCGEPVCLQGAGRTDAGVHAEAQSAHADVPADRMPLRQWPGALNAHLPAAIRIMGAQEVSTDFHARFSAIGKIYRYTIWNGPALPPLERDRVWHVPGAIDPERLAGACGLFTGTHDFAAFSARRRPEPRQTVRSVHAIHCEVAGSKIQLTFEGGGFLYKMVRILAAAAIRHAAGRVTLEELAERLASGTPRFLQTAPACGLCLVKVVYRVS